MGKHRLGYHASLAKKRTVGKHRLGTHAPLEVVRGKRIRLAKNITSALACASLFGLVAPQSVEAANVIVNDTRQYAIGNEPNNKTQEPTTSGNVSGTSVEVQADGEVNNAYGGATKSGTVSSSAVSVVGGTVTGEIIGGYSVDDAAFQNAVTVSGGTIEADVYGGCSDSAGSVTGNTVAVSGGTIKGVQVTEDTVSGNIYGGYSKNNEATDNTVIRNCKFGGNFQGADVSENNFQTLVTGNKRGQISGISYWNGN